MFYTKKNTEYNLVSVKILTNSSGPRASFLRQHTLKLFRVLSSSPHHTAQFWERCQLWLKYRRKKAAEGCLVPPWCYYDIQRPYSALLPIFRHFFTLWVGSTIEISN